MFHNSTSSAPRRRRLVRRALLSAAFATAAFLPTLAGAIDFQDEYAKQIKAADTVESLKGDLFGDSVSLYTGAVTFSATDVSLPGNNALPVAFGRRYTIEPRGDGALSFPLADWDIDIPYVSSVHMEGTGWKVDLGGGNLSTQRCSAPQTPDQIAPSGLDTSTNPATQWEPEEFWIAPSLYIPGRGSNSLLLANPSLPQPAGSKWSTKDNTYLSCVPLAAGSSGQGEGFRARTPDGVTYTFDYMVTRMYSSLIHRTGQVAAHIVAREEVRLYPTRVEDRFGNAVVYTWNGGQLQSIRSADGAGNTDRLLTFTYGIGRIATVSDQTRTWTYSYNNGRLESVTLPDGSSWQYDLGQVLGGNVLLVTTSPGNTPVGAGCIKMTPLQLGAANKRTATITHPSGAVGTFKFDAVRHGRTQVKDECVEVDPDSNPMSPYNYNQYPAEFDTLALVSKTIAGAGIPAVVRPDRTDLPPGYSWTYNYGAIPGATTRECPVSCTNSKNVTVIDPSEDYTVHTFGVRYGINEGQLLGTTFAGKTSGALRTQTFAYTNANGTTAPFPATMGTPPLKTRIDWFSAAQLHPQSQRSTVQDGATFSWTATQFDAFARPTVESRLGIGFTSPLVDTTTYHDDTTSWTLGQVKKVDTSYGATVWTKLEKTYTPNAQLQSEASWGFVQKQYTYNTNGTLATVSDAVGASHQTSLSNYYRGIPRTVTYPLGASESATVNNLGQLDSVTDELGNTTGFTYYPWGRLQTKTQPFDPSNAWAATNYALERVTTNEYGLVGTHWRRTVTTGNRNTVTYYDVMFRPVLVREWDAANPSQVKHQVNRYDAEGRVVFTSFPTYTLPGNSYLLADQGTDSSYDAISRPTATSIDSELGTPLTTSYQYLTGFQRKITNPRGYATTSTFVGWDEPTYDHPKVVTGEDNVTTTFVYTTLGLPYSVNRAGTYGGGTQTILRRFAYDEHMRLCKTYEPEGTGQIIDYNAAGDIFWTAPNPSGTSTFACQREIATDKTTHVYNARRWLIDVIQPAGTDAYSQTFDNDGALKTMSSAGKNWVYEYNNRRLLEKETLTVDGKTFVFDWSYDASGAIASLTYPDGVYVDYAPDAFGRATKAGAYASGVQYHANDAIKEFTYANGIKHSMTPNTRNLPRYSSDKLGTQTIIDYEYLYDRNGNVDTIVDYAQSGLNSKALTYDKFDRLTVASATNSSDSASFTYDPADNLRSMTVGSRVYAYMIDATSNRLVSFTENGANTKAVGYDGRGNITSKGTQTFVFDAANRMLSATAAPGSSGTESYAYDGHNRRVSVQTPGQPNKRYTAYSLNGKLLHERNEQDRPIDYVYLGGSLLARLADGAPTTNLELSTDPLTSANGNFTVKWTSVLASGTYNLTVQRLGDVAQVYNVLAPTVSKVISNPDGGTYQFSLNACPTTGACVAATLSNYGVTPKPVASVNVPTSTQTGSYQVSWPASVGADSYKVEESFNGGAYTVVNAGTTALAITRPGTVSGSYVYRVTAVNGWGARTGTVSATVTVLINTCTTVTSLGTPAIAAITLDTPTSYRVSWSEPACATFYTLEESTDGGINWTGAPGYVSPTIPAAFQNRANGTYTYRVRASRPGNTPVPVSAWSATRSITVAVSTVPSPPANPRVKVSGSSGAPAQDITVYGNNVRVEFSWTAVINAAQYKVRRSSSNPACAYLDGVQTVNAPATLLLNLPVPRTCNGVTYTPAGYAFYVSACNAEGLCSNESVAATVTVDAAGGSRPSDETAALVQLATYYHTDALGSPVAETNGSGSVTKRSRYEPYGAPTDGVYTNGPGYTGHMTDSFAKLSYMQQRYYDPMLGRFMSDDPIITDRTTGANYNRYAYANNSPYQFTDPDGRAANLAIGFLVGVATDAIAQYSLTGTVKPESLLAAGLVGAATSGVSAFYAGAVASGTMSLGRAMGNAAVVNGTIAMSGSALESAVSGEMPVAEKMIVAGIAGALSTGVSMTATFSAVKLPLDSVTAGTPAALGYTVSSTTKEAAETWAQMSATQAGTNAFAAEAFTKASDLGLTTVQKEIESGIDEKK